MADVDLNMVGQWSWGSLQECCQAFVTKLYKRNRKSSVRITKILDYIGMFG